jgi:ribosome biogenesis GTPase
MQGQLALLTANERHKLLKRAAQIRQTTPAKTTRQHDLLDEDDDGERVHLRIRTQRNNLDEVVLKLLREEAEAKLEAEALGETATVLTIHKGRCEVAKLQEEGEPFFCELSPEIERTQQTALAVGDRVLIERRREHIFVERVMPRTTKLSRPDPGSVSRERVIVANIQAAVVVVSVGSPPLHPRLIDRYLVAIQKGGARPVIAVNKLDLLENRQELDQLKPYEDAGIPIHRCSADRRQGLDGLRDELKGELAAFVGHSGVGKSSLLNALRPDLGLEVGSVSGGNHRGAHTTRRSTLHRLGEGVAIIDTPGIRSFGLWSLTADEVEAGFPEFAGLCCRFRDCTHVHEPGCAIKGAVESGSISRYRYETFVRLRESL